MQRVICDSVAIKKTLIDKTILNNAMSTSVVNI
jgi:hypothetical protein